MKGLILFGACLLLPLLRGFAAEGGIGAPGGTVAAALAPPPAWNESTRAVADNFLHGTVEFQGVTATVPRRPGGGLDWGFRGPRDDPEFAWFLNRHQQLPALLVAWQATGEARYRSALNQTLQDWIKSNPRPGRYSFSPAWRALEAARRISDSWLPLLLSASGEAALDPETRHLLTASLAEHAACLRDTHAPSGNHLLTEMTALAALGLAFPEFKDAPQWVAYAIQTTRAELARQFYPDGAHTELANHYQLIALQALQRLADMLRIAGREGDFPGLRPALERAWNYFACTMQPSGAGPLNNDSSHEDNAAAVRAVAEQYGRPDWLEPGAGVQKSYYFPWSGQAVLRGGLGGEAQWALFDAGPHGSAHQHADRLHLSVSAGGRDFLVDNGRYNYQPGPWREYFTGPRAHNVLLLDGRGTLRPPDTVQAPPAVRYESAAAWDFVSATAPFAGDALRGQGPAYHTRAVMYVRDHFWLVVDRILAAGPHQVEALWHFHPDCTVKRDGDLIYTDDAGQANFRLLALNPPPGGWSVDLVRGRATPQPQGWHSPEFNEKRPATCAAFSAKLTRPQIMLWLLWTAPPGETIPILPECKWAADSTSLTFNLAQQGWGAGYAVIPLTPDFPVRFGVSPP